MIINPCAIELFVVIFHSFEAKIADANSSFERPKKMSLY